MPSAMAWDSPSFLCGGSTESSGSANPASRLGGFILPSGGFSFVLTLLLVPAVKKCGI